MGLLWYAYGLNFRRYLLFFTVLFFVVLAFSVQGLIFVAWTTFAAIFFILLIIDFIFLDEKAFKYDPDYNNWVRQTSQAYY